MAKNFELTSFEVQGAAGLDAFLAREPQLVTPTGRKKVASLNDLSPFTPLSAETLVHKSEKDLWSIARQSDGSMVIERMFDDNGQPLKL